MLEQTMLRTETFSKKYRNTFIGELKELGLYFKCEDSSEACYKQAVAYIKNLPKTGQMSLYMKLKEKKKKASRTKSNNFHYKFYNGLVSTTRVVSDHPEIKYDEDDLNTIQPWFLRQAA